MKDNPTVDDLIKAQINFDSINAASPEEISELERKITEDREQRRTVRGRDRARQHDAAVASVQDMTNKFKAKELSHAVCSSLATIPDYEVYRYESPITVVYDNLRQQFEDHVFKIAQDIIVDVDKDELIMALNYDRGQYDKGYKDGMKALAQRVYSIIRDTDMSDYQKYKIESKIRHILYV